MSLDAELQVLAFITLPLYIYVCVCSCVRVCVCIYNVCAFVHVCAYNNDLSLVSEDLTQNLTQNIFSYYDHY